MMRMELAPLEEFTDPALESMEQALAANFGIDVVLGRNFGSPDPEFDARRNQYSAPLILKRMLAQSRQADKVVGVTACDLFIPMLSFVFGQAQLDGKVAVVSLFRLRQEFYAQPPNPGLLIARARKEAVHEAGHLFGLIHCETPGCAMTLSTNIGQLDTKTDRLCEACRRLVREKSK